MGVAVLAVLLRVSLTRSAGMDEHPAPPDAARFAPELMAAAARLYYLQDAAQAEIADRFGTSRPTVSWLLTEARRVDIAAATSANPPTAAWTSWHVQPLLHWASGRSGLSRRAPALHGAGASRAAGPAGRTPAGGGRAAGLLGSAVHAAAQAGLPELRPASSSCRRPGAGTSLRRSSRPTRSPVRSPSRSGRRALLYAPVLPSKALRRLLLDTRGRALCSTRGAGPAALVLGVGGAPACRVSACTGPSLPQRPWLQNAVGGICARFASTTGTAHRWRFPVPSACC